MGLKLHNTLTRTKEEFRPIDPRNVRMYVCGPTVYDFAHIGNARPLIVFDVLYRLLRHLYGIEHVTYVRNITDVDDKINARAAEEHPGLPLNAAIRKVTETTERQFHEDAAALGCLTPTYEPRATENIGEMIGMIKTLIEVRHAYAAEGHVLYAVSTRPDYGKLSNRSTDDMLAGARVEVAPYKRDPMDFVLWKPSTSEQPGWDSPWGRGRPGWHIECSAMSEKLLGETFDIHGGGIDLIFPHHENEIAQSEGAHHGHPLAKVWLHNGFLQVEGEKMSKSLGNFVTIRDLLSGWHNIAWHGAVLRWTMLKTHYRQPLDWTYQGVRDAAFELETIKRWYDPGFLDDPTFDPSDNPVTRALLDDLNTPSAVSEIHSLVADLKAGAARGAAEPRLTAYLAQGLAVMGVDLSAYDANAMFATKQTVDEAKLAQFIRDRAAARKAKNFTEADRIRAELDAMGIALKDSKDAETGELVTTWEVKR